MKEIIEFMQSRERDNMAMLTTLNTLLSIALLSRDQDKVDIINKCLKSLEHCPYPKTS